ncbi:MAG: glycosyltransferase [Myxococcota bacterium]
MSVVLPALDEAARVGPALRALVATPGIDEVVLVDGGSADDTVARAEAVPGVLVLRCGRGRGLQLATGARHATGDALLFLHVDCALPPGAPATVRATLAQRGVVAGAFRLQHRLEPGGARWIRPLLPLAGGHARRSRVPYGDQALFVRADAYRRAGGFARWRCSRTSTWPRACGPRARSASSTRPSSRAPAATPAARCGPRWP